MNKKSLSDKDKKINMKVVDNLIAFLKKEEKRATDSGLKSVPGEYIKYQTKKRDAIKKNDPNYLNDMRSFSLAFLYSILYKNNVIYITSDSDFIELFFILIEGVTDQFVLRTKILSLLSDNEKKDLYKGKPVNLFIDPEEHAKQRSDLMGDFFKDQWKNKSFMFRIKFWDIKKQKYENIDITFNDGMRDIFLSTSGNYNCPPAKNSEMSSCFNFKYWWPPENLQNKDEMRVEVNIKPLISYNNSMVSNQVHDNNCLYSKKDRDNDINFFRSFSDVDSY